MQAPDLRAVYDYSRPPKSRSLLPGALQARPNPLSYAPPLEAGYERKDRGHKLPEFGGGVEEALGVAGDNGGVFEPHQSVVAL